MLTEDISRPSVKGARYFDTNIRLLTEKVNKFLPKQPKTYHAVLFALDLPDAGDTKSTRAWAKSLCRQSNRRNKKHSTILTKGVKPVIRLIYGIPGVGKTALMVAMCIENMYGENALCALKQANEEVAMLNEHGFAVSSPRSEHIVYSNVAIDVTSPNFGYRRNLDLCPDRLGIATDGFEPQYVYRGSTLALDELPDIADCRTWGDFSAGMCRYWAKHRKHRLTIYGTCQDIEQVEKRIRKLAMITQVRNMELIYNKFDEVIQTVWTLYNWDCYEDWENGVEPTEETYVYDGDIREAYNTNDGEEEFYIGLKGKDFSCNYAGYSDFTPQGIENYARKNPIKKKETT